MSVNFPSSWRPLASPHVRAELLSYLKDASRSDLWNRTSEVEFLVHFIFDDHDLDSAIVGDIIFDTGEAEALTTFVRALDDAIGVHSRSLSTITEQDWLGVSTAAGHALQVLLLRGEPTYE